MCFHTCRGTQGLLYHLNQFTSLFAAYVEDAEAGEYGSVGCHGALDLAAQAVEGGYMAPAGGVYRYTDRCFGEVGIGDVCRCLQMQVTLFPVAGVPLETLYCGKVKGGCT